MQHAKNVKDFYRVTVHIRKSVNGNKLIYGFLMTGNTNMHLWVTDAFKRQGRGSEN